MSKNNKDFMSLWTHMPRKQFKQTFKLRKTLGKGSCSIVYQAQYNAQPTSKNLNIPKNGTGIANIQGTLPKVALKKYRSASSQQQRTDIERQVKNVKYLNQNNGPAVNLYGAYRVEKEEYADGELQGQGEEYGQEQRQDKQFDKFSYYLVQELCQMTLQKKIKTTYCSYKQKFKICLELILIIAFLHKHQIMNRDIKPSNILVTRRNGQQMLVIGDFDHSKKINNSQQLQHTIARGSQKYTTLKILKSPTITYYRDIYSTGITLIQIMTNKFLYEINDSYNFLHTHQEQLKNAKIHLSKFQEIKPEFQKILLKCLTDQKYDSAENLYKHMREIESYYEIKSWDFQRQAVQKLWSLRGKQLENQLVNPQSQISQHNSKISSYMSQKSQQQIHQMIINPILPQANTALNAKIAKISPTIPIQKKFASLLSVAMHQQKRKKLQQKQLQNLQKVSPQMKKFNKTLQFIKQSQKNEKNQNQNQKLQTTLKLILFLHIWIIEQGKNKINSNSNSNWSEDILSQLKQNKQKIRKQLKEIQKYYAVEQEFYSKARGENPKQWLIGKFLNMEQFSVYQCFCEKI